MEIIRFQPGLGGIVEDAFLSFGVPGGPWGPA